MLESKLDSPEEQIKLMERRVNQLIEESALAAASGNTQLALERAKEAGTLLDVQRE